MNKFEDENDDEDESNLYWFTCTTVAGGKPSPRWRGAHGGGRGRGRGGKVHQGLLYLPNIPADEVPDGTSEADNVEIRRWWPGQASGAVEPVRLDHQHESAHWDIGEALQLLDMERGARRPHVPLYRGTGARLVRALTAFALDRHTPTYEEIDPPTVVLTETMVSTGHLPKFADDAYHLERDDLWAIPTAEVPLTSMHRGEILEESVLPKRFTAATACFRREAGSAGRDTRGLLRVHEFDKVELFAYTTPEQAPTRRPTYSDAPSPCSRSSGCATGWWTCAPATWAAHRPARSTSRCTRPVSTNGSRSARPAGTATTRPGGPRCAIARRRAGPPELVHTVNGSALAWPRIWAALVRTGASRTGRCCCPNAWRPTSAGRS